MREKKQKLKQNMWRAESRRNAAQSPQTRINYPRLFLAIPLSLKCRKGLCCPLWGLRQHDGLLLLLLLLLRLVLMMEQFKG